MTTISWNLKLRNPIHNNPTPQDTIQSLINPLIHSIYLKIHHNAPIYSQVTRMVSPRQAFQVQSVGIFILYACYIVHPDHHKNNWRVQIMKIYMSFSPVLLLLLDKNTVLHTLVLTYGSAVWRPRVRYNVSRTDFIKLQELACLATTGTMMTAPRAAMEVLLGLLHLHVKTGARPR